MYNYNDSSYYRQQLSLSGKTALVTGASGLLGRHFCLGLAESGADLALLDVQEEAIGLLADEIEDKYNVSAKGFKCDVSKPDSVKETISAVVSEFGCINILLNNAAGKSNDLDLFFAPFEKYDFNQWRQIMSVNLDGMFLVVQAVGNQMVSQGKGGSIIQMSSIYGLLAPDQRIYEGSVHDGQPINSPGVYAASKAGIVGLTRYLAAYWADKGIRVNAIAPGGVESGQNDEFIKRYSSRIPMGRMAQPYEMVGTALYLASDASSYVTGQILAIDGGLTAW